MQPVIFLQLNEINFEILQSYINDGHLPTLAKFFEQHGYIETLSEEEHSNANPWIQWPTVHTGLELAEHQIFRTGDAAFHNHENIYERLEAKGKTVAAISPFNARNRLKSLPFFLPDPWINTPFTGPKSLRWINEALKQVADDYANGRITIKSILKLLAGGSANLLWKNVPYYAWATLNFIVKRGRWYRALVCDRLLVDSLITQWNQHRPDYCSVFLNAAAHLQHHYMYSSKSYQGPHANPSWYARESADPLLDAYQLYDNCLADIQQRCPDARILIGTALRQVPHDRWSLYYRLDHHETVLDQLRVPYSSISPLMTEDFVVHCANEKQAQIAEKILNETTASVDDLFYVDNADVAVRRTVTGSHPFYVDNRGRSLYVQLKPTCREIPKNLSLHHGDITIANVDKQASFVQFKNSHHEGLGYFSDSGREQGELPAQIRLSSLFSYVEEAVTGFATHEKTAREASKESLAA